MAKRALLIGIDNYQDPGLRLVAPRNDVTTLRNALGLAGYSTDSVEVLLDSNGPSMTTNTIRKKIRNFFEQAIQDDELLLYISGHGIEQDGHRLIIPSDYFLDDPQPPTNLVGDQYFYSQGRYSKAKSILIVIDACREGVRLALVEDQAVRKSVSLPSEQQSQVDNTPTIAILYSCDSGEYSLAEGGPEGCSYFTEVLCFVLKGDNDFATLQEVIIAMQNRLDIILAEKSLPKYTIALDDRPIIGRAGLPDRLVIKENLTARIRQRITDSYWCNEIKKLPLWDILERCTPSLAQQVLWLILGSESLFNQAEKCLSNQRWRDRNAPTRVLRRMHDLLNDINQLTAPEIGFAVAAVYIYEAALAGGELQLLNCGDPLHFPLCENDTTNSTRMWRAFRASIQAEEAMMRRYEILQKEGLTEAAEDLASWQLVRFLHGSGEVWEYSPPQSINSIGWVNTILHTLFGPAPFSEVIKDQRIHKLLDGRRLLRLARLSFATEEDIELECLGESQRRLVKDRLLGQGAAEWRVDEVAVAHILNLSSALSVDARRLHPVLAEHLGRPNDINANNLIKALTELIWRRVGENMELDYECPYEVIDFALGDLVGSMNRHRQSLNDGDSIRQGLLQALPRYFDDEGLKSKLDFDNNPIYLKPHLRLSMDQSRIRELLMGKSLYGNPESALRELYQNAMDACRYRRARARYLKTSGKSIDEFVGQIVFRVGYENGRAYVECQDNGIGMGVRQIRTLFSRAGQRFTDSHEFHVEKALWEEQGINFWPNSRFGIGVFSYFMLADELLVETKRQKENGFDYENGLRLLAVGSGSLFRLQQVDGIPPGTRVRLYLNHDDNLEEFLPNMLDWLWLPEFNVVLIDSNNHETFLVAGQPAAGFLKRVCQPVAVPESSGDNGQPRLFWNIAKNSEYSDTREETIILVDGIKTELSDRHQISVNALVVNLSDELRPELSVDRRQVISTELAKEWIDKQIRKGAYRYILENQSFDLLDLESIFIHQPLVLYLLDNALRTNEISETCISVHINNVSYELQNKHFSLDPFLDDIILEFLNNNKKDSSKRRRTNSVNSLLSLPVRTQISRWLSARGAILFNSGLTAIPLSFKYLAKFAEKKSWEYFPSLGLRLLFDINSSYLSNPSKEKLTIKTFNEASLTWMMTPNEIAEIALPLNKLGGEFDDLEKLLNDWQNSQALISKDSKSKSSDKLFEFLSKAEKILPIHFMIASLKLKVSLKDIIQTSRSLIDSGLISVNFELDSLTKMPPLPDESCLLIVPSLLLRIMSTDELSKVLNKYELRYILVNGDDLISKITLAHIALAILALELPCNRIIALASPLKDWGVLLPDLDNISPEHLSAVYTQWLCMIAFHQNCNQPTLTCPIIAWISKTTKVSVTELIPYVSIVKEWGISIPNISDLPNSIPDQEKSWLLVSPNLDDDTLPISDISIQHLARAALFWDMPLEEINELAKPWAVWGITLPDFSTLPQSVVPQKRQLQFFTKTKEGQEKIEWLQKINLLHILEFAEKWSMTTEEVMHLAQPWINLLCDQPFPEAPFAVDKRAKSLLDNKEYLIWENELTALDVAVTASGHDDNPFNYVNALNQIGAFGVDITEALEFANFCLQTSEADSH